MQPNNNRGPILTLPMAIVLGAAIIAGSALYIYHPWTNAPAPAPSAVQNGQPDASSLPPVTAADHILGNPNAPVKIVEYSDPSCPYCKVFHQTMLQVMAAYGSSGKVAWIYRHFPLDKPDASGAVLHPNAGHEAEAFECAADQGGNQGFWAFANKLFATTPSVTPQTPAGLDQSQLPVIAKSVGLDVAKFSACLASATFASKIAAEYQDGAKLGIQGTPTSYIVTKGVNPITIAGAQPYGTIKAAIDALLFNQGYSTTTTQ